MRGEGEWRIEGRGDEGIEDVYRLYLSNRILKSASHLVFIDGCEVFMVKITYANVCIFSRKIQKASRHSILYNGVTKYKDLKSLLSRIMTIVPVGTLGECLN